METILKAAKIFSNAAIEESIRMQAIAEKTRENLERSKKLRMEVTNRLNELKNKNNGNNKSHN